VSSDSGNETASDSGGESVSPQKAREMLAANEATAIDIRDDEAWREGHIAGARHHSADEIDDALEEIDSEQTVIVVCEDGSESREVASKLSDGDRTAVIVEGGMESWRSDDMPMQPSTDPKEGSPI
jgi:rhodanese-related sulfurtransferase